MSRATDREALRPFRPMLWLVAAAVFMQMLDTTIVNTALPSMAVDLGQSPLRMQSVVVAYALTVAMLIPASGWLADRLGTRRLFVAAIALFSLGSLACALSPNLDVLVASRVLQGVGGAMMMPVGRLAVLRAVPRTAFLAAMSFVTVPGLVGPLIGPALGGPREMELFGNGQGIAKVPELHKHHASVYGMRLIRPYRPPRLSSGFKRGRPCRSRDEASAAVRSGGVGPRP